VSDQGSADVGPGLSSRPTEDRGHETARWYAYQYALAARECLAMLIGPVPWMICEWHTDFVCAGPNGAKPHCLVSVKHRSNDQGPWALADLPKKGGFKVLYDRWVASDRWHTCRWVTNGGLKPGDMQTRELASLLRDHAVADRERRLMKFATMLCDGLGSDPSDTASFLDTLAVFSTGGDEFSMRAKVIEDVARPVMQRLGVAPGLARTAYLAAHDLVYEAVLNLNPDEPDVIWMTADDQADADRLKRTITRERLLDRLRDRGIGIPPDAGLAGAPLVSNMVRKLRAGHLGPTVVASAPRLRRRWYELEASFKSEILTPMQMELDRVRAEVLHCAIMAESRTRSAGQAYGTAMHRELTDLLSKCEFIGRFPASPTDLMGCAYQITDECDIWWSDEFDPHYEAPWVSGHPSAPYTVSGEAAPGSAETGGFA
jgi:hypothetical protein